MMAMNIGFLVLDVAGLVSFGATTAASSAGKAGIKAGVKVAAKSAAKAVAKQVGKTGLKTAVKLTAKGARKAFCKSIDKIVGKASVGHVCVFACFPAGTKINTAFGLKNIEDIKAGDRVWSYDELTGETGLQEIVQTMVRESDHTVELYTKEEIIETTAEHPFLTENGWKDAADLQTGDRIKSRNEEDIEIKDVKFSYRPRKVYNFEVSNWHTYFVGALVWLVHNAEKCISKIFKISRKKYPNHVKLIEEAKREGLPTRLKRGAGKKAAKKNRYEAQKAIRKKQGGPKEGFDYDEYPYASTQQGGKGAKIKEVPSSENQEVGRNLGKFYKDNEIGNGDYFDIEIIE